MEITSDPKLVIPASTELPPYEPPTVTTYTDEQLLQALGPAQALRGYGPPLG